MLVLKGAALMDAMKIGDVARQLQIHPNTIRRLEKNGLIQIQRTLTGYRIFTPEIVEKIRQIYAKGSK